MWRRNSNLVKLVDLNGRDLVGDSGKADLPAMYRLSAKLALTPVGSESDEELLSLPGPDNALINTLCIFKPAAFTLALGTCRQIRTN